MSVWSSKDLVPDARKLIDHQAKVLFFRMSLCDSPDLLEFVQSTGCNTSWPACGAAASPDEPAREAVSPRSSVALVMALSILPSRSCLSAMVAGAE